MSEKIRVIRVSRPHLGGQYYIVEDLGTAASELQMLLEEDEVGDRLVFELAEMTRKEIEALPEFDGW